MAKKKNNNMQDQVVSGLYLTSVAFTFTILSRLAGNIMYGGSEPETIKEQEIKKLQEIITNVNTLEQENDITDYLNDLFIAELGKDNKDVITYSELGKYYHFNTLYDILPKDPYNEACGGPENALEHHKLGKTKLGGFIGDVLLGIFMPFIILYYSIKLIYTSINPGDIGKVKDTTDKYSIANFGNSLRSFINSDVVPDSYRQGLNGAIEKKKKLQILGGLNPIGGANFDTIQKAGVFMIQMVTFLLIFAPLVFLSTSKPSASEFAMIGFGCNLVYIGAVLGFIRMNGGIKSIWDVIMNCKLKIYCFNFIVAMGIWYLLFTSIIKDKKIENSTTGMGVALIFIIAVLSVDYLMNRSKK